MKELRLTIPDQCFEQLELLRGDLALADQKDLINNALALLTWAVGQRQKGRLIASLPGHNAQTFSELSMPCLDQVKPKP